MRQGPGQRHTCALSGVGASARTINLDLNLRVSLVRAWAPDGQNMRVAMLHKAAGRVHAPRAHERYSANTRKGLSELVTAVK